MYLFVDKGVYIIPYNSVEIDGKVIKDKYKESYNENYRDYSKECIVKNKNCMNYILKFTDGRFTLPCFKILICNNLYEKIFIEVSNFTYFCEVFYEFRYFNFIYKYFNETDKEFGKEAGKKIGEGRNIVYLETDNRKKEEKEYNNIFSVSTKKRMEKYKEMEIKINKKLNKMNKENFKKEVKLNKKINKEGKTDYKVIKEINDLNDKKLGIEISFYPKIYDSIHTSLNNSEFYFSKNISTQIYKLLSTNKMKLEDLKKCICKENGEENGEETFLKHINSLIFYGIVVYKNEFLYIKY
ncbi:hypothetical protein CWI37_1175p0020 [Hamiltosporidium tvaerminnensis]|uniref:Uncharacterized protein n=1 Tax=Hamiltosporidium tvaerminnensis TaxID=1176355 RepID=A0A4Q9KZ20_9MICR|nr:hypothetical protein CWI37_1175p0020 [Hamiltosporidium tvaerminnensis]